MAQHFGMSSSSASATSYIGSPLHDLNAVDPRPPDITDGNRATVDDCIREFEKSLPLHNEDRSGLDRNMPLGGGSYDLSTLEDITPIESARARFLQIVVDHFIGEHVVEMVDSEVDYSGESCQEKLSKRKEREVVYEGDPSYALPLMYVANMYETLVNDVNLRLASLNGFRDKTIGVALEAAGGLYRKLAKKFPKKGPCTFKRRELATSLETRTRFPELVIQEEKRVRFVVVNGLDIVEKPNSMPMDDAEWFKRLTGRNEIVVYARDYKFYSPRHKYRRVNSSSVSNIPMLPGFASDNSALLNSTQGGFRAVNEAQSQQKHIMQQAQYHQHMGEYSQCGPEMGHAHMSCLQPLPGSHLGGRSHVLPAKFCDECGAPYLRETSKFCSECGVKRLGI